MLLSCADAACPHRARRNMALTATPCLFPGLLFTDGRDRRQRPVVVVNTSVSQRTQAYVQAGLPQPAQLALRAREAGGCGRAAPRHEHARACKGELGHGPGTFEGKLKPATSIA